MSTTDELLTDLGPCCACGRSGPQVRNVMLMPQRGPQPGSGWGCLQCGLPNDGAVAVLCDICAQEERPPTEVCAGRPAESKMRVPIAQLAPGEFEHDVSKHPEVGAPPAVAIQVYEDELNELIAIAGERCRGQDPNNLPTLERVLVRIIAAAATPSGTCMVCGCSDAQACPGGCEWLNDRETICSACL